MAEHLPSTGKEALDLISSTTENKGSGSAEKGAWLKIINLLPPCKVNHILFYFIPSVSAVTPMCYYISVYVNSM